MFLLQWKETEKNCSHGMITSLYKMKQPSTKYRQSIEENTQNANCDHLSW